MAQGSKVIAIVDDDQAMLDAIEVVLTAKGFAVQVFTSAEAFLDARAANGAACLVLDINLSGMSGIELRERLKSEGSQLPVIFMTGADSDAIRTQATNVGCVALLRKPFAPSLLTSAITKAVSNSKLRTLRGHPS
jgi:FixJ family two-component response regulator